MGVDIFCFVIWFRCSKYKIQRVDHRRRIRSISRSRSPEDHSCSSVSRSRSPDEVYSHRKRRESKHYPSNHSTDNVGWLRRIKNKLGFHHPVRRNTGVYAHHGSIANPVSNGKLHRKSNDQAVRKNKQVKKEPKQHGHVRKFFGGVVGHFLGPKSSTADKRRLEKIHRNP